MITILLATAQVRGVDGSGGLGDVPVGLANELNALGSVEIRLVMPGYSIISGRGLEHRFDDKNLVLRGLQVRFGDRDMSVDVFQVVVPQPPRTPPLVCYLFRCPEIFDQVDSQTGKVNKDTADKAILLSRAVVEFVRTFRGVKFDLIHCNDWQTGLIPAYFKALYPEDSACKSIATLYTTHNAGVGFQGSFPEGGHLLSLAGLDSKGLFGIGQSRSLEHFGHFNFTKGGIAFADLVNTVSSTYHRELCTPAFAGALDGIFRERGADFDGIVNGIDYHEWNPAADNAILPVKFSANDSIEMIQQVKRNLRSMLRKWTSSKGSNPFAALSADRIMIAVVGRMDFQKIPILFRAISDIVSRRDVQLCLLGDAHPNDKLGQRYAESIEKIAKASDGNVLFYRGFDVPLSHLLYAASEVFIVASVFEPCGLTQLVAMRYGSVPIVRRTGGLADTIVDEADFEFSARATGFLFKEAVRDDKMIDDTVASDGLIAAVRASEELIAAVRRALTIYRDHPERWALLTQNGMAKDSSWKIPSLQYLHLYREAIRRARLVH